MRFSLRNIALKINQPRRLLLDYRRSPHSPFRAFNGKDRKVASQQKARQIIIRTKFYLATMKQPKDGWLSGCSSVGIVVDSDNCGTRFESNHWRILKNIYCQLRWKDENKEKEARNGPLKNVDLLLFWTWHSSIPVEREKIIQFFVLRKIFKNEFDAKGRNKSQRVIS